ncbi:MAG: pyridoxamine 5'-phosphate oxidase family protein [Actinomycetes bacterium]
MTDDDARRFAAMSRSDCLQRLGAGTIGRVAYNTLDGPQILPVTYVLHESQVVFRTSAYGPLAELQAGRPVAFEVDEFDPRTRTGWSVLIRGRALGARRPEQLQTLWREADPVPWAGGNRNLFVCVSIDQLTGRVISRAPRDED